MADWIDAKAKGSDGLEPRVEAAVIEQRRCFLKWIGGLTVTVLSGARGLLASARSTPRAAAANPLIGTNAYYLLVEAYRKVSRNQRRRLYGTVKNYLEDDLRLFDLRDRCCLNTLRFWAFNDYPKPDSTILPGAFDGRLWDTARTPDSLAFDVLEALVDALKETELYLIPVLGNYWVSYGGILQYLVWAGELPPDKYKAALCQKYQEREKLYLEHTLRFYTSPAVEHCFRLHTGAVLERLAKSPYVVIIDVLNEPRCKTEYSLHNKPLKDGRYMSDIVARWLNRQATWIRRQWHKFSGKTCRISSGEEGWSESPPPRQTRALKNEGQFYEGIDLRKNLMLQPGGLDTGSVHVYPHRVVWKRKLNECGYPFVDRRGWEHLLRADLPKTRENFEILSLEWILSRAKLLGNNPWYIGEMGWCWPVSNKDFTPLSSDRLQKERIQLYRQWTNAALHAGALGTCIWMLNGCEHKDDFYGLTRRQLAEILGR